MRVAVPSFWLKLIASVLIVALTMSSVAAPPKRNTRATRQSKTVPNAREAGLASVKKVQLRRALRSLGSQMRSVRAKIYAAKTKESHLHESIDTVESRITRTRSSLTRVTNRLRALDRRHDVVVARLDATEDRLTRRRRLLSRRLSENYQRGQATYAQALLRSRSLHEVISRGYYVRQIVRSDTDLIQEVKKDIQQIREDKRELEAQAREQKVLAAEFEEQKHQYLDDLGRKQEILHGVQQARAQAEDQLDELEDESRLMTDRIRALSEMLRRRQEAKRQAALARRRLRFPSGPRSRRESEPAEDISPVWRGGFLRPCPGPVTSGFGYRFHPILHRRKRHTGVDFGASYGTPIRAAGAGTVLLAQYNRGYGNCVILDHGNGLTTLYGHASRLNVSAGDIVRAGQVIALVGSTGLSTGPHLHFEVRRDGVPVQPPF